MVHSTQFDQKFLFWGVFLANMTGGMIIGLPQAALPLLASHTHVPLDIAGGIFTGTSLGGILGTALAGLLSRRWHSKYLLAIGVAIMGVTTLVGPLTQVFAILFFAQCLQGGGFGLLNVSLNLIVASAFRDELGSALNALHSAFGIGALLGPLLLSLALATLHVPIWAFIFSPFLALIAIIMLLRQHVPGYVGLSAIGQPSDASTRRTMLLQIVVWLTALQLFLYVGAEVSFSSWIVTALKLSTTSSLVVAAPVATVFWIGLTCGRLCGAQFLKKGLISERCLLYLCLIGGSMSILMIATCSGLLWFSFSATLLTGFFYGPVFPGLMALASRRFARELGFVSSMILISAGVSTLIFPVLIGVIFTHVGIGWGLAIPALLSLLTIVPFYLITSHSY